MRVMQRIDDLAYAGAGKFPAKTEIVAPHTVKLTWQVDGGPVQSAELDLSDEHLAEYGQHMFVLLHAYQVNNPRPEAPPAPDGPPPEDASMAEKRQYRRRMKQFADEAHLRSIDEPDRPAYMTPSGARYWPHWLEKSYETWVQTGEIVIPQAAEEARQRSLERQIRSGD